MCVGSMLRYALRVCNVMPWTRAFELNEKGVLITYATLGCLWVGKRVCMGMEVYIDCACRLLGVCRIKRV